MISCKLFLMFHQCIILFLICHLFNNSNCRSTLTNLLGKLDSHNQRCCRMHTQFVQSTKEWFSAGSSSIKQQSECRNTRKLSRCIKWAPMAPNGHLVCIVLEEMWRCCRHPSQSCPWFNIPVCSDCHHKQQSHLQNCFYWMHHLYLVY